MFAASGHRVVCFEPQSICCAFIRRVCDRNGFTRVISGYRSEIADISAEILRLVGRDLDRADEPPEAVAYAAE